ncbi:fungal-specific transcription factor [Trichoderma arundinaceum]|uniref:Fungal-specific transcription factor n=1 Tax=Trichoderma arundinaceum TaxID=490622 RepID=A0A395NW86_TRIAR|nr:fungal-specific transcription factor [Trichoderma arundinaceum]
MGLGNASWPYAKLAKQVCASCKVSKRKCTKELPRCSLCVKKDLVCQYAQSARSSPGSPPVWSQPSVTDGDQQNTQALSVQNVLFLDSRILHYGRAMPCGATPGHVIDLIGDAHDIKIMSSRFFDTIQYWMPIVSKRSFYGHHLQQSSSPRPELAILLLCMKLISEVPSDDDQSPKNTLYHATKQFYQEVETAGILSFQVLQAGILLCLYEIGHAIYPSAFLSVGACARYAHALGITGDGRSQINRPLTWVEQEEIRRVWWAIVVMDRFVGLGCRGRSFVIEHPQPHFILPAEEAAWDNGIIKNNNLNTVSHPSENQMSKFALVAQAASLLGQVLEHTSTLATNPKLHEDKFKQLDRTIHALMNAAETTNIPACDPLAICFR